MKFLGLGRACAAALLWLLAIPMVRGNDFQYFLPQEFLSDLPLREGSFAAEVIQYLLKAVFPDMHHEKVDSGIFTKTYADSDFNSPKYRSQRSICVQVPPGGNPDHVPHMCERPGASAPHAEILKAGSVGEIGRFELAADFAFSVPGYLKIYADIICLFFDCGHKKICKGDVRIEGALRVRSMVAVTTSKGAVKLQPNTSVNWLSEPRVKGCNPDYLVRHLRDVRGKLTHGVKDKVQKYLTDNMQSQLVLPQTQSLHPDLNLTYKLQQLRFVQSNAPFNQSFVIADAKCTIHARAPNGTVQVFPDPNAPWTGHHNPLPMDVPWRRAQGTGAKQLVTLGGARFSKELLTMLERSMHYVGMLHSDNSSRVKDAMLYSTIDMSSPEVDISQERSGVVMRQDHLHFQISCLDHMAGNASNFSLMNATFSNVLEEISISAYVPNDHTAGITLQVIHVSMGSANLSAFHSQAFMGRESDLKALALQAMRKGLPLLNQQLNSTPIIFCGGGSSACSLVPFAPHPAVSTSPAGHMKPGYVQLVWHCQCGSSDFYESCKGFQCPEANNEEAPIEVRQLRRTVTREVAVIQESSPSGAFLSLFSNHRCSFDPDQSMVFAKVTEGCTASDYPSLAPAFAIQSYKSGWHLHSGCKSSDCSSCSVKQWIPLRKCTCLASSGPCVVMSSTSDSCVSCI